MNNLSQSASDELAELERKVKEYVTITPFALIVKARI